VLRNGAPGPSRGFVLLARGTSGWLDATTARFTRSSGTAFVADQQARRADSNAALPRQPMRFSWSVGDVHYGAEYDAQTDSLRIAGSTLFLGDGNVVLLDRVDGVGGPPGVRLAGCVALDPSRSVADRALALPAAREFVR